MTDKKDETPEAAEHGVILRASNGDVIRYEPSGLSLRLSDRVIADIAARLEQQGFRHVGAASETAVESEAEIAAFPDDIDAWDIRRDGDWLSFTADLPGKQGVRGFRREVAGGAIIADAPGPLLGLLSIGGARAALASQRACDFPHHVFAPADDIGAVGHAGEGQATRQQRMQPLTEMTHEALVAERLLAHARATKGAMPLFFVRAETDTSADAATLGNGDALANFIEAARNFVAAAEHLGKRPKLLAVCLDFALEDVAGDATAYRDGVIALMDRITGALGKLGLPPPVYLAVFECGTWDIVSGAAIEGQWELAWNHAAHDLSITMPGYMLELDENGRLTDAARSLRAAMSAEALSVLSQGGTWSCPVLHLAEREGKVIRVTAQGEGALVIDKDDPFGAGKLAGFRLDGVENGAAITKVAVDAKDKRAVLLTCSKEPEGADLHVTYAVGADPVKGPYPANCGALRDTFEPALSAPDDDPALRARMKRWALPARLKLR